MFGQNWFTTSSREQKVTACIHNAETYGKIFRIYGGIPIVKFYILQFSQNMDGFRQNDCYILQSKYGWLFREFIKLNKQNPLEKMYIFTIYQNYTLALKVP